MQDVAAAAPLETEAKLTAREGVAREAPTIEARGALDVRSAQDVYLNLQSSEVASLTREGADLVLVDTNGEVLRLEGYFDGPTPRKLFLEGQDDKVVEMETAGAVSDGPLALSAVPGTEISPFVSLTTDSGVAALAAAGGGFGGAGAAAGAAGLAGAAAAAGGGGGGGGGGTDPTTPPVDTTPPAAATNVTFTNAGGTVTGSGEIGAAVTIRNAAGVVIGTGTVGANGAFSVNLQTPLTNGEAVTVTLTDAAGNVSGPTAATAPDTTAPNAPSNVDVSDDGATVTGTGEPGSTVTVQGPGGGVIGTGVVGPDGGFTVPIQPAQTNGETVTVTQTDPAGNGSAPTTASAPDTTAPDAPSGVAVAPDGDAVTGQGEAGATVTVRGPDGTVLGTATVDETGNFSVPLSPPLIASETVTVTQTDPAGNPSPDASATAPDLTFPGGPDGLDAPTVLVAEAAGGINGAELADGIQVRINLTPGTQVGDRVVVTLTGGPGGTFDYIVTAGEVAAGVAEVVLPAGLADGSYSVTAVIDDGLGNASTPSQPFPFVVDATTAIPVITSANGAALSGTAEAGAIVTLLDANGAPALNGAGVQITATVDVNGNWTIPASAVPGGLNGFQGAVLSTDGAGNTATASVPTIDGSTDVPVVTGANGFGIQGTAEAGATIALLDANGAPVLAADGVTPVTVLVDADGNWTILASSLLNPLDGFQGSVQATDPAGNRASADVPLIDGDITMSLNVDPVTADNIINIAEAGAASVTVSGTAFGDYSGVTTVRVSLSAGLFLDVPLNPDGTWSASFTGAEISSFTSVTVSAVVTTPSGPVVVSDTHAYAVDLTPPPTPVIISANGAGISGSAEAGATVTLLDGLGNPLTSVVAGPNGLWTIPAANISAPLDGFTGSVLVTDPPGNPTSVAVGPIDGLTSAPTIDLANGTGLQGMAEAGATLVLLNGSGQPVLGAGGAPVTVVADSSGGWSIPASAVPFALDGFTGSIRATDPAGNTAASAVGPVDGSTSAPVILSADGSGISGTAEAGATVTLVDSAGQPVLDVNGQPLSVTADANGQWSFPAGQFQNGIDGFTGAVNAMDPAGNAAATNVGPIDGAVSLSLFVDAVTADNVVNLAESQATVTVTGAAYGDYTAGQTVTLTTTSGAVFTGVLGADGRFSIAVTGAALGASSAVSASVQTTNSGGASVTVSTNHPYGVDLVAAPAVILQANGLALAGTTEAGIGVALFNAAGTQIATVVSGADGSWSFAASAVPGGLNGFAGTVRTVDSAGNPASVAIGPVDGSTPAPVIVTANGAGLSGTAEAGATVALLNADGSPVLNGSGAPVTATVGANGNWSVPASAVPGGLDGFTGSVKATDGPGNTAATSVGPVDGSTTAPVITAANGAGIQGTAEANGTIALLDVNGNPVIGANGQPITAAVGANGAWSIPASATQNGFDGFEGSVRATDLAGNTATTAISPIDGGINLSLNIDAVTGDNILNLAESGLASVTITGSVIGDSSSVTNLVVTLSNGVFAPAVVDVNGNWSVTFSGAALAASTSVTVTANAMDNAGNTTTVTDVQTYVVDLIPPAAAVVNANGSAITGTGEPGANIVLLTAGGNPVTNGAGAVLSVVVGAGGTWSLPATGVPGGVNGFTGSIRATDAAGNATIVAVGPVDGVTVAPTIVQANGLGLSGTAEANATIALLNANGTPVLGAGGAPIVVTADGFGAWTIAPPPGGLNGFTGSVRATDAVGNVASGAVGPVDGVTPPPVIVAANGAVLSGTAEVGATITLLDAGGAPVLNGGNPVTATVGANGTWSIPNASVPGGLNGFSGSVQATDPAGNTAQTSVPTIDGTVNLTLQVNPITADNIINGAEAAQASVTVSGTASGEFTPGDTVRVELSTGVFQTATLGANGAWSVTFSGAALAASTSVTATAVVQDNSGNTATVADVQPYDVDLSTAAPAILTANGTGLSGTAEAGATIVIRAADGHTVATTTAGVGGAWSIPAASVAAALNGFTGSIQSTDAAGNTAVTALGPVDAVLSLTVVANAVTADNILNIQEAAAGSITVTGTVTGEYRPTDQVVITLANGVSQTVAIGAGGAWSAAFPGSALAASAGFTASVTSTDAAGNTGTVTTEHAFGIDLVAPNAPVVVSAGGAGLTGSGEAGATIQLLTAGGAPVTGASGQPITVQVAANGQWTIPASAFVPGSLNGFTGQVRAVDVAGNASAVTTVPAIDLTPPSGSTTSVSIDVIAGDDIVNLAESRGTVTVTGQVTGEFRAGDQITVTAGAATATVAVGADGRWSAGLPGSALTGGTVQAVVQASDLAGNIGAIAATPRPYTADLVSPGGTAGTDAPVLTIAAAADGLINPVELAAGVTANVTLTPSAQAGDTVTLTLNMGGVSQAFNVVLSQAQVNAGQIGIVIGSGLVDGNYSAVAVIRDAAGNVSAPSAGLNFQVDAVPIAIGTATASVTENALGVVSSGVIAISGQTGPVTVALQAPTASLTSHGVAVTWSTDAGGALIGSAGGRTVVRATVSSTGAYTVTLLDALDHPAQGADTIQLPIGVRVTDSDGTATGTISVSIQDGVPQMAAPVTLTPGSPGVIVGSLVQSFHADGGSLTSVTIDGRVFTYNAASGTVSLGGTATNTIASYGVQNGVLSATTTRGEAITVNFSTGAYTVDVTGNSVAAANQVAPQVSMGGNAGLLGLVNADALGLIRLDQQQFFTASDANNDINQVVVRYAAALSVGAKTFGYSAALATELGLVVSQTNTNFLSTTSQLTITAVGGGAVDNMKLNEFLGSLTFTGGLASLLSLSVGQTFSIQATDATGHTTTASESNLANLSLLSGLLTATQPAQILYGTAGNDTITASDVGTGTALDNRIYGYGGNDTLNGGLGNDILRGGAGNDTLNGGAGNDILIGGTGNDILTGGAGQDLFRWEVGDQGTIAVPAQDIITDFSTASLALGGDVLDLSSLLQGEGRIGINPGNLANFVHFQQTAGGTLIHISTTGGFVGGFGSVTATGANQTILLQNVNLTSGFTSDQAILADLLERGKLIVDEMNSPVPPNHTLTIGGSAVDGDGDTGSTSLIIDSTNVTPIAANPANVAPVVEAQADALLGVLGLGALGLNLAQQDLLAADANGNLSRVELEYAPLVAVNLTPLSFGYSAALAASYGYQVQVTQSTGLLGVVAPTARISITALNGGVLDNAQINEFLATVHLTDPASGSLLSSTLLSANLLNALTITAEDAQGLSNSVVVGSVLDVNLLNSLDEAGTTLLTTSVSSRIVSEDSSGDDTSAVDTHLLSSTWVAEDLVTVPQESAVFDGPEGRWTSGGESVHAVRIDSFDVSATHEAIAAYVEDGHDLYIPGAQSDALAADGTAFSVTTDSVGSVDIGAVAPTPIFDEEASLVLA